MNELIYYLAFLVNHENIKKSHDNLFYLIFRTKKKIFFSLYGFIL